MSVAESKGGNSSMDDDGRPPTLSIKLPKMSDLPRKSKPWNNVNDHLPVDVLLLTVEDCEFLASYYYLRNQFKSYHKSLGLVYFGSMGDEEKPLKVALMRSSDPGGSQTAVKNAVTQLRPRVVYSSGFCSGLNREKAKLGDVVISSKLTTEAYRTPVSRDIGNIITSAAVGWDAPLENPEARDIKVHCNGELLSCADPDSAERQRRLHPGATALEMEGKGEIRHKQLVFRAKALSLTFNKQNNIRQKSSISLQYFWSFGDLMVRGPHPPPGGKELRMVRGLRPAGPLDPESSTLTIWSPKLPITFLLFNKCMHCPYMVRMLLLSIIRT